MKKGILLVAVIFLFTGNLFAQSADHAVISEAYGGGGNSGSTWKNDFIELYNPTESVISLTGWSVQYASATGTSWSVTNLSGSIAPHGFYLIQQAAGTGGTTNLPTPDIIGTTAMSGTGFKVALCNTTTTLSGTASTGASIVDFVGCGSANGFEGTVAPAPSNTTSIERKASSASTAATLAGSGTEVNMGNGYDTNNNASDFVAQTVINPQNSSSASEPELAGGDVTPPSIVSMKVLSSTQLELLFNEPVELTSATTLTNYTITKSIIVNSAERDASNIKRVVLTVTTMTTDFYSLTVQNIKDTTGNIMSEPVEFKYTVGILTIAQAREAGPGVLIRTRGLITVAKEFYSPSFMQDETGGIAVYGSNFSNSAHIGDIWEVAGTLKDFNSLLEIDPISDTIRISTSNPLPVPKIINSTQFTESLEGQLVRVNKVKFATSGSFAASDSTYVTGDPSGVMSLRIDKDSNIPANAIPADSVNIVGILSDYKGTYQLQPRSINDIGVVDPPSDQTWSDIFAVRGLPDSTLVKLRGVVSFVQPSTVSAPTAHTVYFQDATGGMALYDPMTDTLHVGDSIEVKGKLIAYRNLQELKLVDSLTILARNVTLPAPIQVSIAQAAEIYESRIISIPIVQFIETGNFTIGTASGVTYHITDGSRQLDVRVPHGSPFDGTAIPVGAIDLTGVLGQFDVNYQLIPRELTDIEIIPGPGMETLPEITMLTDTSFSVTWKTLTNGNSQIIYGTTQALGDTLTIDESTTTHSVTLSGRTSGRLYYFVVASSNTSGVSTSLMYPMVTTSSQSSGQMDVYFNYPVDLTLGLTPVANGSVDLLDKLLERISSASKSIDIALYSFDDFSSSAKVTANTVADSLIAAKSRGVEVRMVFDNKATSTALGKLISAGISVQKRNVINDEGIMHNKFFIFDGRDTTSATDDWVIMGSWNVTDIGTYNDAQDAIFIQDQSLARIYTIEFEEMFGSSSEMANSTAAKFGPNKKDNTPHFTFIGGNKVEVYFSPSDLTTSKIIRALATANENIFFGLLSFTRDDIRVQLIAAYNSGIIVRGLIDQEPSELSNLSTAGTDVLSAGHSVVSGLFHHKYGIIDPTNNASDPIVIAGSHNWSTNAETDNDENTLIIHSGEIARQYTQEFAKRYKESGGTGMLVSGINSILPGRFDLSQNYPNPFNPSTEFQFQIPNSGLVTIKIFDILGRQVETLLNEVKPAGTYKATWNASTLPSGVYFYQIQAGNYFGVKKALLLK